MRCTKLIFRQRSRIKFPLCLILLLSISAGFAAPLKLKNGGELTFSVLRRSGKNELQVILTDGQKVLLKRSQLSEEEAERRLPPLHIYGKAIPVKSRLPNDFNLNEFKEKLVPMVDLLKRDEYKNIGSELTKLAGSNKLWKVDPYYVASKIPIMEYFYFVPDKKNIKKDKKVPLVVFLHGKGDEYKLAKHPQIFTFIDPKNQKKYPCFFLAPQLNGKVLNGSSWCNMNEGCVSMNLLPVIGIIKKMLREFPGIDEKRIYVTGLSSGGFAAWESLLKFPDFFAAAFPVACGYDEMVPMITDKIKKHSVWAFNNPNEKMKARKGGAKMLVKFANCGGEAKYTEYIKYRTDAKGNRKKVKGNRHAAWLWAYAEPDLIPWLFSIKNSTKASKNHEEEKQY